MEHPTLKQIAHRPRYPLHFDHHHRFETRVVVRLFDFIEGWCDASEPLSWEDALRSWNEWTKDGTCSTESLNRNGQPKQLAIDADYYAIFPADTRMLYDATRTVQ